MIEIGTQAEAEIWAMLAAGALAGGASTNQAEDRADLMLGLLRKRQVPTGKWTDKDGLSKLPSKASGVDGLAAELSELQLERDGG